MGLLCVVAGYSKAQSTFSGLFILNNNISEIQAISDLGKHSNVSEITHFATNQINFVHNQNLFIEGRSNLTLLIFDDDKLTQQNVRIWFDATDGQVCIDKYKQLLNEFNSNKTYKVYNYTTNDSSTHEKIGEEFYVSKIGDSNWKARVFYFVEFDGNKIRDFELDVIRYSYNPFLSYAK